MEVKNGTEARHATAAAGIDIPFAYLTQGTCSRDELRLPIPRPGPDLGFILPGQDGPQADAKRLRKAEACELTSDVPWMLESLYRLRGL